MGEDETEKVQDTQPMNMGDVLEWLGTFSMLAAYFWRKGYERGKAA